MPVRSFPSIADVVPRVRGEGKELQDGKKIFSADPTPVTI